MLESNLLIATMLVGRLGVARPCIQVLGQARPLAPTIRPKCSALGSRRPARAELSWDLARLPFPARNVGVLQPPVAERRPSSDKLAVHAELVDCLPFCSDSNHTRSSLAPRPDTSQAFRCRCAGGRSNMVPPRACHLGGYPRLLQGGGDLRTTTWDDDPVRNGSPAMPRSGEPRCGH